MPFRTAARLGASAALTAALLPLTAPAAVPEPAPENETETVRVPLGDVTADRAGARLVRTGTRFEMIGLTWTGPAPDRVEVRTRTADGWSRWTALEALPESRATEPLWTGDADEAQVRATRDRADVTDQLEFVGINPPNASPGSPQATSPGAETVPGAPRVVNRAQWGADESDMTWAPEPTSLKATTVHHTAGSNDYSCADSATIVRGIYHYHAVELGWGDIGYHALVDECGTIFEGRSGGMAGDVVGGHAAGFNRHTFGISMMGNFDRAQPSAATVESVSHLAAWKLDTAQIPADDRTRLVSEGASSSKYPEGAPVDLPVIFAHRDVSKTACPGELGYDRLGEIRSRAVALQRAQQP
ncbi:peptidoglycan recognition protein [Saccharopolyspora griseoalba]|uniref:Peptidoglycan recognition protein n=1 Tax=Saccharopolyspora griseoalba TaxID=1431848 RepID=A0ABW2LKS9_9PSEU